MVESHHSSIFNAKATNWRSRRSRGLALLAVLWILSLLALMAATFTRTSRTEVNLAHNSMERFQAEALTDAAIHWTIAKLTQPVDDGGWTLDGSVHSLDLETGEVRVAVSDEGGKIDLNAASPELLQALFLALNQGLDESAALAGAIVDFRDRDDLRHLNGAEDDDYAAAGLNHDAKDNPFEDVIELQQVLGMTADLYRQVAPVLTIHTRRRQPNPMTAGALVRAALSGQTLNQAEGTAEESTDEPSGTQTESPAADVTGIHGLRSRFNLYSVHAEARTAGGAVFARDAVVRITGNADMPFQLLASRQGLRSLFAEDFDEEILAEDAEFFEQN